MFHPCGCNTAFAPEACICPIAVGILFDDGASVAVIARKTSWPDRIGFQERDHHRERAISPPDLLLSVSALAA